MALSSAGVVDHKTIYYAARINKKTASDYEALLHSPRRCRFHHLRTEQGRREVDVVVEIAGSELIGVEIKATAAPTRNDARHLAWLRDELGSRFGVGVVLHTGPRQFELGERLIAVPIASLWV